MTATPNPAPHRGETVFIVDDDEAMRDSLTWLLEGNGYTVRAYSSAEQFLAAYDAGQVSCLILDVRMPGMSGPELQERMIAENINIPIVFITGHGDVPMAVESLRAGAKDFFQKPFESKRLLARIAEVIELDARMRRQRTTRAEIQARLDRLTPRETEVVDRIVDGLPTKAIAAALGSSFNTVQNQRASIIRKLQAESVADLVRMVMMVRVGGE